MKIPLSIVMSPIKGGAFEWDAKTRRGWWWKGGKLIADWGINKGGSVVVNWHDEQAVAPTDGAVK